MAKGEELEGPCHIGMWKNTDQRKGRINFLFHISGILNILKYIYRY